MSAEPETPSSSSMPDARWRTEIEELHRFFEAWFRGTLPPEGEALTRLERALDPDLVFISPAGVRHTTEELLAEIGGAHGSRPELEIRIREPELRWTSGGLLAATYEEWQTELGDTTGRTSTVVFRRDDQGPNGLRWVHVHESWLPGAGPSG